jgi:type II secretory pathway predicted ATPase ExeA/septal ring-binding cell division protein DamX
MYYQHFGLDRPPFRITPDTGFFFGGGNRGAILEALVYAVTHGDGIVKVTGEVGTGKTMLCTMLESRLPASVETVYVPNPNLSPPEMLTAIAGELHLTTQSGATRIELMQRLAAHLVERHAKGQRVVAFIEEAQSMPDQTLEEIRLLSNLETHSDRLLQIVLFGQPELDARLRAPSLRSLRDRIAHSFRLQPLTAREISGYLHFRLRTAGYRGPDLFSRRTVRMITCASHGLARRVNLIADKALLATFADNRHEIRARDIRTAVGETAFAEAQARRFSPARAVIALLVIGAVAAAVWYAFKAGGIARLAAASPAFAALASAVTPAPAPAPRSVTTGTASAVAERDTTVPPAAKPSRPAQAPVAQVQTSNAVRPPKPADPANAAVATSGSAKTAVPAAANAAGTPTSVPPATPADPAPAAKLAKAAAPATPAKTADHADPHGDANAMAAVPAQPASDLLQQRLSATRRWLNDPGGRYSIQLMWSRDPDTLRTRIDDIAKMLERDKIFIYRIEKKRKTSMVVLYGSFDDRDAAERALAQLPQTLKVYRPYLRTLSDIRQEAAEFPAS